MPENYIVTLKTAQPGVVWPAIRGVFAMIGFVAVVAVGLHTVNDEQVQRAFKAGTDAAAQQSVGHPWPVVKDIPDIGPVTPDTASQQSGGTARVWMGGQTPPPDIPDTAAGPCADGFDTSKRCADWLAQSH